jgi:DNA-directed RNA polymerase specialized sigma24 family protein
VEPDWDRRDCAGSALGRPSATDENAHAARQLGVTRRRGASLEEREALYRSRFGVFARVAASVTGDSERAGDVVQEAFAIAVSKRRSFRAAGPLEGLGVAHRP